MLRCVLIVTLLVHGCVAARSGGEGEPSGAGRSLSAQQSLLAAFELYSDGSYRAPAQVQEDLSDARSVASSSEAKMIDTLRPILSDKVEHRPVSPAEQRLVAKLLQQFGKEHPSDFPVQLAVAKGLDHIERELQMNLGGASGSEGDTSATPQSVMRALNLVGMFPNQSLAHAHLATQLTASGGDQLKGMRSYVRCLQLDPNSTACRSGLQLMAADYTKPRCSEYYRNQFSIQRAYTQAKRLGKGGDIIRLDGQTFYTDRRLVVTGSDIQEITEAAAADDKSWTILLKPEGAQAYGALTSELAAKQDYALIKVEGKAVAAPRVLTPVDSGQLGLARAKLNPGRLCQRLERRTLPPELAELVRPGS